MTGIKSSSYSTLMVKWEISGIDFCSKSNIFSITCNMDHFDVLSNCSGVHNRLVQIITRLKKIPTLQLWCAVQKITKPPIWKHFNLTLAKKLKPSATAQAWSGFRPQNCLMEVNCVAFLLCGTESHPPPQHKWLGWMKSVTLCKTTTDIAWIFNQYLHFWVKIKEGKVSSF